MTTEVAERDAALPAKTLPERNEGLGDLLRTVTEGGADPTVIKMVADLYKGERDDVRRMEFAAAMTQAQGEMGTIAKDSSNPQTHSKYASYAAIDKAIRPIYAKHGFSLSFDTGEACTPEMVTVLCFVAHTSGFERTYHIQMPTDGKGAKGGSVMTKTHATGSAFAYGKRYLVGMIFNLSTGESDDDGNAAGEPPEPTLNPGEITVIRGLLGKLPPDTEGRMLRNYGVKRIEDIPRNVYDQAGLVLSKHISNIEEAERDIDEELPL